MLSLPLQSQTQQCSMASISSQAKATVRIPTGHLCAVINVLTTIVGFSSLVLQKEWWIWILLSPGGKTHFICRCSFQDKLLHFPLSECRSAHFLTFFTLVICRVVFLLHSRVSTVIPFLKNCYLGILISTEQCVFLFWFHKGWHTSFCAKKQKK